MSLFTDVTDVVREHTSEVTPLKDRDWVQDMYDFIVSASKPPKIQCPKCGRFASYLSERHYYNGQFNCFSFDTECKKCGIHTTVCV